MMKINKQQKKSDVYTQAIRAFAIIMIVYFLFVFLDPLVNIFVKLFKTL